MKKWNFYTTREIKPHGWLKRQLELQAEGLAGNLDKVWPLVRDSVWIGQEQTNGALDMGFSGWEVVPYWLDGFIPLAYLLENEDMIARAKKYVDAIIERQCEDGWICPCEEEERADYDTWATQLILKALTVYYECSGDERILDVLYKALKNYYELLETGKIKLFDWAKIRWFDAMFAINLLYKKQKEDWLLKLASLLMEQGTEFDKYRDLWKVPLYRIVLETHIVNITMMMRWEALSCDLLGKEYADVAEEYYNILSTYNGTPVELFTGDEHLAGLSPIHGSELCSVVELMLSYENLYAYTGDPKWAERLEVIAFNALPAAFTDDMWAHQYDQLSNQIACEEFPGKPIFGTNASTAHTFRLFRCCTANHGQGWPKFTLSAFMHSGDTVMNALMIPSELHADGKHIRLETNYPFENTMRYIIDTDKDFVFKIRIPSFAKNLLVNGKKASCDELSFDIKAGSNIEILVSFETEPYFKKRPYDLYTVQCGSLVYSVPIQYQSIKHEYEKDGMVKKYPFCDYDLLPESAWNYAYSSTDLCLKKRTVADIPFSSKEPPVIIKAKVKQIPWGLEHGYEKVCAKVPVSRVPITEEQEIDLYPYGCAKLRMTEIPMVD